MLEQKNGLIWSKYLLDHPPSTSPSHYSRKNEAFKRLIQQGIPKHLRRQLWRLFSGLEEEHRVAAQYERYLFHPHVSKKKIKKNTNYLYFFVFKY